jgi:unsaturated pyranuronate lyase
MEKASWQDLPTESMGDLVSRQMMSGGNATVGRFLLARGAVIPRHSHVSEQYSVILAGTVRFIFDDRQVDVASGEILFIPANVPHSVEALEDSVDLDFFAPRREEWIRREDSYLRKIAPDGK